MIETRDCQLISDLGLQECLLGFRKFCLRFQDEEDGSLSQFIFALFGSGVLSREIHGFFAGGDAQFGLLELMDRVAHVEHDLLAELTFGV